jgi:NADPH:quinone reductase-like Zn-dependent oxidoreductase
VYALCERRELLLGVGPEATREGEAVRAIVYTHYGPADVLQLKDVGKPTPGNDEVLVRLDAVSLNRSDWEGLTGEPFYARIGGLRRPRHQVLGSDIAGRVEAVGKDVQRFQPGDDVFGDILWHMGGFAEYVCAREKYLAKKPAGLTFEQVAAIPQAGAIALQGIRDKGQVRKGQQVLINGAGGGGGMFAVQLAKLYGAEVTGVDRGDKLNFMRSLGADHVIDYTREDFASTGKHYDLILDLVARRSVFDCQRALKPRGAYYAVGGPGATLLQIALVGPVVGLLTGKKLRVLVVKPSVTDLLHLANLCEAGTIVPVIDWRFPLNETPAALRYVGEGHVKGKVVVTVGHVDT